MHETGPQPQPQPQVQGTTPSAALVTGGGRRIGRAIGLGLARRGFRVAVHYGQSQAEAEAVVAEIAAEGGKAVALGADLGREAEVSTLLERAIEALGPIGCLVNNASRFEYDSALSATRDSWDLHLETNLRAPFVLMQAFARELPPAHSGCIINVLDERVWNLTPHFVSYTVSKTALWTLTQTMALALAPRIRVNAIGPGPTLPSVHQSPEQFARQVQRLPLQRGASPEEISHAVNFLLDAPAMTGQMIALDGGQHLGWAQPGPDDAARD
ncbi:SDR family oxidoreductase [Pendulispora albinea]|uniref:SDR family oxidoreductase n=1 Tax=Pendulispora albinea TaxID=2741071 RepID=A0ABZ2MBL3_9BACT